MDLRNVLAGLISILLGWTIAETICWVQHIRRERARLGKWRDVMKELHDSGFEPEIFHEQVRQHKRTEKEFHKHRKENNYGS